MQTMEEKPVLKHNPLPRRKRAAWDAIIATEGVKMGLDGCRAFLENKIVNDIFYEGLYKGRPCVVKCSSRAPVSIKNEYDMSRRLAAVDPRACAEALDLWTAPDGRRAFVVLRRLPGPSLTDILSRDVGEDEAVAIIEDMIRIAEALKKSGIVWRDIISDNFIRDDEGHFRLIDAQFAVDRADFREIPFLRSHWSYRTIVFANHPMMAGRGWNDAAMMLFFVWKLSASPRAVELCERLRGMAKESAFPVELAAGDERRLKWTLLRLRAARALALSKSRKARLNSRIAHVRMILKNDHSLWDEVLFAPPRERKK